MFDSITQNPTAQKHIRFAQIAFRLIQLLAAIIGLILWSVYLSRLSANGGSALRAVLGIFVAGTLWVFIAIAQYVWRHRNEKGNKTRWSVLVGVALFVAALDLCFVILFATAAGLTGPSSSSARGNGVCYAGNEDDNDNNNTAGTTDPNACNQVKGVFALSILNV